MDIISRIFQIVDSLNLTISEFSKNVGVSNGYFAKQKANNGNVGSHILEKIVRRYPEISTDWLLTGEGKIFKTKSTEFVTDIKGNTNGNKISNKRKVQNLLPNTRTSFPKTPAPIKDEDENESILITQRFPLRTDHPVELQRIPLYDFDATAGMVGLFSENNVQYPIDYLSIPDLPHVDGAIFVRGDSMYPLLKSGDIVVYKAINSLSNIMWGEMYIVDCDLDGDDYTAVKFLNKVDGDDSQALLVSHNSHHAPKAIPLSAIRALAIVKASIRYNVMG